VVVKKDDYRIIICCTGIEVHFILLGTIIKRAFDLCIGISFRCCSLPSQVLCPREVLATSKYVFITADFTPCFLVAITKFDSTYAPSLFQKIVINIVESAILLSLLIFMDGVSKGVLSVL
jgi:hypothetical protein